MGRDHRRGDPRFDSRAVLLRDRQKLDRVPELLREGDVLLVDLPDPLDEDLFRGNVPAGGDPYEDRELVRRVDPVDVERRVRLGETGGLGLGEDLGERLPLPGHARQDVVARPVDDPEDRPDPVRRQAFPQRPDDRDPPADARLESDVDAGGLDGLDDFRSALREQGLVRRHHRLSVADRLEQEVLRSARAADEFDENMNVGVPGNPHPVLDENPLRQAKAPFPRGVAVRHPDEADRDPDALAEKLRVLEEKLDRAGADGSETDDADPDLPRGNGHFALTFGGDWSIPFTPRIACLIRCSFSTSANRTNPSPCSPKPIPGGTATLAFVRRSFENSTEPISRNGSGMGAHTNIVPFGFSNSHPMRANPSTRQSLRFR